MKGRAESRETAVMGDVSINKTLCTSRKRREHHFSRSVAILQFYAQYVKINRALPGAWVALTSSRRSNSSAVNAATPTSFTATPRTFF